jgi:AcrR family transcriptional regulator
VKKPRGRYHHGDLARAALDAARQEIDAHGAEGFTLERVAHRLGVGPSALYRHYENREALLVAFLWETLVRFVAVMDEAVLKEREPRAVLRALATVYTRFAIENPGWFRLQFSRAGMQLNLKHDEAAPKYPEAVFAALRQIFGNDTRTVETWYVSIWSLAHGAASLTLEQVFPHLKTDAERLAEAMRIIDAVLGVLPAPKRPSPRASRRR